MSIPVVATDFYQHYLLHLFDYHFLVEVLDPKTLEPVGLEEEG